MKLKHTNSILETFEYFCQKSSKSIPIFLSYTVSKLCIFWDTVHSVLPWQSSSCFQRAFYIHLIGSSILADNYCISITITKTMVYGERESTRWAFSWTNSSAWPYRPHWFLEIFFGTGAVATGRHLVLMLRPHGTRPGCLCGMRPAPPGYRSINQNIFNVA